VNTGQSPFLLYLNGCFREIEYLVAELSDHFSRRVSTPQLHTLISSLREENHLLKLDVEKFKRFSIKVEVRSRFEAITRKIYNDHSEIENNNPTAVSTWLATSISNSFSNQLWKDLEDKNPKLKQIQGSYLSRTSTNLYGELSAPIHSGFDEFELNLSKKDFGDNENRYEILKALFSKYNQTDKDGKEKFIFE
jgi:hypothetical protein